MGLHKRSLSISFSCLFQQMLSNVRVDSEAHVIFEFKEWKQPNYNVDVFSGDAGKPGSVDGTGLSAFPNSPHEIYLSATACCFVTVEMAPFNWSPLENLLKHFF